MPSFPPDLERAREVLARRAGIRLAILFGSVARGTPRPDSDLDIAIECSGPVDVLDLARELSIAAAREVHIVSLDDASVPLLDEIVRDGSVLYEGSSGAAAQWRSRALCTLDLDRPWYARMRDAWLKRVAERGLSHGES